MKNQKRTVCQIANRIKGMSRSEAFKSAWAIVKGQAMEKVSGVKYGRRQEAIRRLERYAPNSVKVQLVREWDNRIDTNAIAVFVSVAGSKSFKMGYLPAAAAASIAPAIDSGVSIRAAAFKIVGGFMGFSYGLRVVMAA